MGPVRLAGANALAPRLHACLSVAARGVKGVYLHGEPVSGGLVGDTIAVALWDSTHWQVTLESRGRRFAYGRFEPRIDWTVRMLDSTRLLPRLDFMWYRPPRSYAFLPQANWSLDARGTVTLEKGTYSVRTISDDAVRVWIDSLLVIDNWTPHESQVDYAPLPAGKHDYGSSTGKWMAGSSCGWMSFAGQREALDPQG